MGAPQVHLWVHKHTEILCPSPGPENSQQHCSILLVGRQPNVHHEEEEKTHGTLREHDETSVSSRATVNERSQPTTTATCAEFMKMNSKPGKANSDVGSGSSKEPQGARD